MNELQKLISIREEMSKEILSLMMKKNIKRKVVAEDLGVTGITLTKAIKDQKNEKLLASVLDYCRNYNK